VGGLEVVVGKDYKYKRITASRGEITILATVRKGKREKKSETMTATYLLSLTAIRFEHSNVFCYERERSQGCPLHQCILDPRHSVGEIIGGPTYFVQIQNYK
jgi:hypothetical protein